MLHKSCKVSYVTKYLYLVIGMSSPSKDSHNVSPSSIRDPNLEFKKDRQNKNENIMTYKIHMNHTPYS